MKLAARFHRYIQSQRNDGPIFLISLCIVIRHPVTGHFLRIDVRPEHQDGIGSVSSAVTVEADRYFPNLDNAPNWEIVEEEGPFQHEDLTFTYVTYKRK